MRGGQVYVHLDGTLEFYISRMIKGRRYNHVRLCATDFDVAHEKLATWERDPENYNPAGDVATAPVRLTADLVEKYAAWLAEVPPGKHLPRNTDPTWVAKKRRILLALVDELARFNLRADGTRGAITTDDIHDLLKAGTDYRNRVESIKHFYTFLETEMRGDLRIQPWHNPTKALRVPTSEAEQLQYGESKVAWSKKDADTVIAWLASYTPGNGTWGKVAKVDSALLKKSTLTFAEAATYLGVSPESLRVFVSRGVIGCEGSNGVGATFHKVDLDAYRNGRRRGNKRDTAYKVALALKLLGGTGWHAREAARFSAQGKVMELDDDHVRQHGAVKALMCIHKTKRILPTPVTAEVAKAAEELLRMGGVSAQAISVWTRRAVEATKVAAFTPGRFRHRIATRRKNMGVDKQQISDAMGHGKGSTTDIYTVFGAEPKLPTWY